MQHVAVIQDIKICLDCTVCVAHCGQQYNFKDKAAGASTISRKVGNPNLDSLAFLSCHHCEKPLCITACMHNVIVRTDFGVVVTDQSHCQGCMLCADACPWHVPCTSNGSTSAIKCNLCEGRAAKDMTSSCVQSCPKGALRVMTISELSSARQGYGAKILKRIIGER